MIELIWGILNIAILIYFIIVCFKSAKIIREKLGGLATLVFVFGILSFVGKPHDEKDKVFDLQEVTQSNRFEGNTYSVKKTLEDNLVTEINLAIKFGENEKGKKILRLYTSREGFVSGTNWKTETANIDNTENKNIGSYEIYGILEWRLMGVRIYSGLKHFKGKIELKK